MSLYSHGFELLPRPPRSIFSLSGAATRATLPDLASVDELRTFVRRVVVFEYTITSYFPQLYFSIALLCLLIVAAILVLLTRMYERSFWLVRIVKRPTGSLIVPNALLAFTVAEVLYACVYVVYAVFQHLWFKSHTKLPHGFAVWLLVTWCPLFLGPTLAVWGTHHAATTLRAAPIAMTDLEGTNISARMTWWRRLRQCAMLSNVLFIAVPVLLMLSIVIPAACADAHNQRAIQYQQQWLADYGGQAIFTEAMVQDAQRVWFAFLDGIRVASVVFAVWTAYANVLGFAYVAVTWRLILYVRNEMIKSKISSHKLQLVVDTTVKSKRRVEEVMGNVEVMMKKLPPPCEDDERSIGSAVDVAPMHTAAADHLLSNTVGGRGGGIVTSRTSHLLAQVRTYIPDLIVTEDDHTATEQQPATPALSKRSEQVNQLRKAYYHILIQAGLVAPGIFFFAAMACWACLRAESSAEQPYPGGGTYLQTVMPQILLAANWATVVIASMFVLAIAQRTYEPILRRIAQ